MAVVKEPTEFDVFALVNERELCLGVIEQVRLDLLKLLLIAGSNGGIEGVAPGHGGAIALISEFPDLRDQVKADRDPRTDDRGAKRARVVGVDGLGDARLGGRIPYLVVQVLKSVHLRLSWLMILPLRIAARLATP